MSDISVNKGEPSQIEKFAADPASPQWMKRVPVVTGALAALAGFLTVRGQTLSNTAIYSNTIAAIKREESTDKWNEYQADSIKKTVTENMLATPGMTPEKIAELKTNAKKFADREPALADQAHSLKDLHDAALGDGKFLMKEKGLTTDYAGVAAQLGIALASVAALTKKSGVFYLGICCGIAGLAITGYSLVAHYFH